jgi:hypothetical protein
VVEDDQVGRKSTVGGDVEHAIADGERTARVRADEREVALRGARHGADELAGFVEVTGDGLGPEDRAAAIMVVDGGAAVGRGPVLGDRDVGAAGVVGRDVQRAQIE